MTHASAASVSMRELIVLLEAKGYTYIGIELRKMKDPTLYECRVIETFLLFLPAGEVTFMEELEQRLRLLEVDQGRMEWTLELSNIEKSRCFVGCIIEGKTDYRLVQNARRDVVRHFKGKHLVVYCIVMAVLKDQLSVFVQQNPSSTKSEIIEELVHDCMDGKLSDIELTHKFIRCTRHIDMQ